MNKCLVTKLNGSVTNNDTLLKVGEMRIKILPVAVKNDATQMLSIGVSNPTKLDIIGNAYFTDKLLSENKGKSITIQNNNVPVFVSDSCEISILYKYNIKSLDIHYNGQTSPIYAKNKEFSLDSLEYSTQTAFLNIHDTQVSGDISALKNLTGLTVLELGNTQVSGDISALKNLTGLTILGLSNTQVSGDISALKNLTGLTTLGLSNTQVSGDISALKNLTGLTTLGLSGLNEISGPISDIPDSVLFISNAKGSSVFTWKDTNRKYILALEKIHCSNIDKLLIDMSKLEAKFKDDNVYSKKIGLIGTRTSASDEAVATLQSKGYTVSVTPA